MPPAEGDFAGFWHWLRLAVNVGNGGAALEMRKSDIRQIWPLTRKAMRSRPFQEGRQLTPTLQAIERVQA